MKRFFCLLLCLCLLAGCSTHDSSLQRGVDLRERILTGNGCHFTLEITADFGDSIYTFCLDCEADKQGNISFCVDAPESIQGISGKIDAMGGKLTFDDKVLAFSLLADGEVSPVSAPWLFLKTLRSGYLTSAGMDGDLLRLTIDDSYEEDALQLDIWVDKTELPIYAEVIWQGRRVLSMSVQDFSIL